MCQLLMITNDKLNTSNLCTHQLDLWEQLVLEVVTSGQYKIHEQSPQLMLTLTGFTCMGTQNWSIYHKLIKFGG